MLAEVLDCRRQVPVVVSVVPIVVIVLSIRTRRFGEELLDQYQPPTP